MGAAQTKTHPTKVIECASTQVGGSSFRISFCMTCVDTGWERPAFWRRIVANGGSRYTSSTRAP